MYGTTDNIVALERENIRAYVLIADLTQHTPFLSSTGFPGCASPTWVFTGLS